MKFPARVICLAVLATSSSLSGQATQTNVVGDLRVHDFTSRVFGNTRKLRVLLPAGYDAPGNRTRRYPVLYLNDGQNLFDSTTSTLNPMEWRVDETVAGMVAKRELPPIIVVGIDNAGRRGRFKEYFPWRDEYLDPPEPDPQGKRYPEFLVDEVLPFIESRYRVAREPSGRGIGGSSAGALAAMYAVISRPGIFGRLLVESPSVYVDDYHVLRDALSVRQWPQRIYLGVGTNESGSATCDPAVEDAELVTDVKRFRKVLIDAGVAARRIDLTITPCGVHNEQAWAARLPRALSFLFGR
jgi:predicted alpha/beta superfamily hydrolase